MGDVVLEGFHLEIRATAVELGIGEGAFFFRSFSASAGIILLCSGFDFSDSSNKISFHE
jgi:hypothetical protein